MSEAASALLKGPLIACAQGRMAPNMALMHLLSEAPDENAARNALHEITSKSSHDAAAAARIAVLNALWRQSPGAFQLLRKVAGMAQGSTASACDWARAFDEAAGISPEASVALYSLGSAELLGNITEELVDRTAEWNLFAPDFVVLDLGCGIGRIAGAIARHVHQVLAVDCSEAMTHLARSATKELQGVSVVRSSGDNLEFLRDACFDSVLAIDSFPYLVQAQTAERHLCEIARVLKPGGRLLIMNYSYRGDLARDRLEVASFAAQFGFDILRNGTSDLELWDGRAFVLQKG
jgi:SAM-dependent methyltransferase